MQVVLIFDLDVGGVLGADSTVPWLSGRASASHAEGRWFDPSRDHKNPWWGLGLRRCDAAPFPSGSLGINSHDQQSTPAGIGARFAGPHRHAVDHGIDRLKIRDVGDAQFLAAVFADQHHTEAVRADPEL